MTEKRLFVGRKTVEDRFTIINDYENEIGVKENRSGDVLVLKHSDLNAQQFVAQLVVFLNDQNQAIVDLYDGSKYWSDKATEKIKELQNENEQLKNEKESWKKSWIEEMEDQEEQSKCILKLVKENEKLKSTVKEVLELLSDEVDLFSDKATEHDINAYVELKELDNKDAFYMAIATKKAIKMLKELQE